MNDKEIINELYLKLCDASITKDIKVLNEILSDDYILIHMTGKNQTKQDYINSVKKRRIKILRINP